MKKIRMMLRGKYPTNLAIRSGGYMTDSYMLAPESWWTGTLVDRLRGFDDDCIWRHGRLEHNICKTPISDLLDRYRDVSACSELTLDSTTDGVSTLIDERGQTVECQSRYLDGIPAGHNLVHSVGGWGDREPIRVCAASELVALIMPIRS